MHVRSVSSPSWTGCMQANKRSPLKPTIKLGNKIWRSREMLQCADRKAQFHPTKRCSNCYLGLQCFGVAWHFAYDSSIDCEKKAVMLTFLWGSTSTEPHSFCTWSLRLMQKEFANAKKYKCWVCNAHWHIMQSQGWRKNGQLVPYDPRPRRISLKDLPSAFLSLAAWSIAKCRIYNIKNRARLTREGAAKTGIERTHGLISAWDLTLLPEPVYIIREQVSFLTKTCPDNLSALTSAMSVFVPKHICRLVQPNKSFRTCIVS